MYSIFERLLNEKGVTVAEVCRATGIRQSTLSNWKKRNNNLTAKNAKLIAEYFNVSVDYLYGNDGDIVKEMNEQNIFETLLKINGWSIKHIDPSANRPCSQCLSLNTDENGDPLWAKDDITSQIKLCDKCVLHDSRHIISKGDTTLSFSDEEYRSLISRNQYETIESVLQYNKIDNDDDIPYKIPIVRRVAAGIPIDSIEEIIDWEELPAHMSLNGTYFGLLIQGDSMEPGIRNGDVVIVREQPDAEDGEVVVALVNGNDGCCKRLKKYEDGTIALMSDNPSYPPMYSTTSERDHVPVQIKGVVRELRRKF